GGLSIDMDRFAALMDDQRRRAQEAVKKGAVGEQAVGDVVSRVGKTEFLGYQTTVADGRVEAVLVGGAEAGAAQEGQDVLLLLNRTPFYAEGGGQVGDQGVIRTEGGVVRVTDTTRGPGDTIVHMGRVESGEVRVGEGAHAEVDPEFRAGSARSHTATHMVHWTLR